MHIVVTIVHILTCALLIGVVLLQQGKGADMGAVFGGGSSSTIFGSGGAGNFLTRLTTGLAVVFMVTSLVLTYSSAQRIGSTVFDSAPLSEPPPASGAGQPVDVAPQAAPPQEGAPAAAAPAAGEAPQPAAPAAAEPQAAAPAPADAAQE
jgi:preprotein translocase subunit SecG